MNSYKNLIISGSASVAGGTFDRVNISGSAKIDGDIICKKFEANGAAKANGNIESDYIEINGAVKINGNCSFNEMQVNGTTSISGDSNGGDIEVNGSAKFIGNINAKCCEISGSISVEGSISSDEIKSQGMLNVSKDCEGEKIHLAGGFRVDGLINGEEIEIKSGWSSRASSIGGKKITIKEGYGFGGLGILISSVKKIFTGESALVNCDSIEGDDIYLENTSAKIVRGKNIVLGKNCNIQKIEYTENFQNNYESTVGEVINIQNTDIII